MDIHRNVGVRLRQLTLAFSIIVCHYEITTELLSIITVIHMHISGRICY
jgi:hypothetical protein